jgi:hypothetical protein
LQAEGTALHGSCGSLFFRKGAPLAETCGPQALDEYATMAAFVYKHNHRAS